MNYLLIVQVFVRIPVVMGGQYSTPIHSFLFKFYWISALGAGFALLAGLRWAWTTGLDRDWPNLEAGRGIKLPLHAQVHDAPGWWGMVVGLLVNGTFYISLLFGYLYLWAVAPGWPPATFIESPPVLALLSALAMTASAIALDRAVRGNAVGRSPEHGLMVALAGAMVATIALGFIVAIGIAPPTTHAYAATTAVLLGYCALHTGLTVVFSGYAVLRWRRSYISPVRSLDLRVIRLWGMYAAVVTLIALALVHGLPALLGELA